MLVLVLAALVLVVVGVGIKHQAWLFFLFKTIDQPDASNWFLPAAPVLILTATVRLSGCWLPLAIGCC